jgi:hypothetical protein
MSRRIALAVPGLLAFLVGAVFTGQGVDLIHGSSMSGHGVYAVLGVVLMAIGVGLLVSAWRRPRLTRGGSQESR